MKTIEETTAWLKERIEKAEKIIADWQSQPPTPTTADVIYGWKHKLLGLRQTLEFIEGGTGFIPVGKIIEEKPPL